MNPDLDVRLRMPSKAERERAASDSRLKFAESHLCGQARALSALSGVRVLVRVQNGLPTFAKRTVRPVRHRPAVRHLGCETAADARIPENKVTLDYYN